MKQVKAYIKPHRLYEVTLSLHKIDGLTGMSVTKVLGFGRGRAKEDKDKVTEGGVDMVPHLKIEIVCRDELVEEIVSAIERAAHTGLRGDGKIYVLEVTDAVRISTGERGKRAV
ncbi:MAG: P-II family nitrogen regulator [Desulfobacteraceae bacterium]|nr:MAG: P-II family nitrogen regulator [Desulfobacteraceae bacterium]